MRITDILRKQHIGWHFKKHWIAQGKLKVKKTNAEKILKNKNVEIIDAKDIVFPKREITKYNVVGYLPKPVAFDENHPDWHSRPLLTYKDHNVLLEGLTQAKLLTNTIEPQSGLPKLKIEKVDKEIDEQIKKIILASHVFDAQQEKLPKIKDPKRPMFNFPRILGITQERAYKLLISRLLQLIESKNDLNLVRQRGLIDNLLFSYPFERFGDLIQFELKGDTVLTTNTPLKPITTDGSLNEEIPDIHPIKPTITLVEENIYKIRNIYPIKGTVQKSHPHTVFVFHDRENVKNLFEEEVTEQQIFGRSLLKTFTVAASYARSKFGDDIQRLPEPVVVQCVQTDGRLFHFGVLQLNTLNLDHNNYRNYWYQSKHLSLFDICEYKNGRPTLEGYNNTVFSHLNALYNNA